MVGGDSTLRDKSPAQFFELFMGMPPAAYRSTVPDHVVSAAGFGGIANKNGKVIWVDGNLTSLGGNLGTPDEPVVLIVNGNLETAGNTVVNGFVFVMGNVEKMNGTVTIYGGLVTAGSFSAAAPHRSSTTPYCSPRLTTHWAARTRWPAPGGTGRRVES